MSAPKMLEGDVAEFLAAALNTTTAQVVDGWEFSGLDIGEIEATAPDGTLYRLSVEIVPEDER